MVKNEPAVAANGKYYICDIAKVLGMHRNTIANNMSNGVLKYHVGRAKKRFSFGSDVLRFWLTH